MGIYRIHRRKVLWIGVLLVAALIIAGCAGIEPYEPRNNREEGPEKGLFTGSGGEWVIVGPKKPETDKEDEEHPDKPTDGKQP
jgi:hypothetical protein